jgi:hypothetical protein
MQGMDALAERGLYRRVIHRAGFRYPVAPERSAKVPDADVHIAVIDDGLLVHIRKEFFLGYNSAPVLKQIREDIRHENDHL